MYAKKDMPLIGKCNQGGFRDQIPLQSVSIAWDFWICEIWVYIENAEQLNQGKITQALTTFAARVKSRHTVNKHEMYSNTNHQTQVQRKCLHFTEISWSEAGIAY